MTAATPLPSVAAQMLTPARRQALQAALASSPAVRLTSLAGSAPAMLLGAMALDGGLLPAGEPLLVIGDDPDDAGYLAADLAAILGPDAVAYFPSGFKRDIRYGQPDEPSRILRTEALTRWTSLRAVVTCPEALAEQVATREVLSAHTLHIACGAEMDMADTARWLRDNGFRQADYVYEPGQYSIRGSLMDIFGYSHELPVRVDFLGDEIDSIRLFDIETQLSTERRDAFDVTSGVTDATGRRTSLLDFTGPSTVIAVRGGLTHTLERIRAIAAGEFSANASLAAEGDPRALEQVVDPEAFARSIAAFKVLAFTAGGRGAAAADAPASAPIIDFDCSPQAVYHKNFDLIASSLADFEARGYTFCILSDNPSQHERLRAIFADRGDAVAFTPVCPTLHAGFADAATHRCIFTDHQIFDRYHRYTLKSDRARSGKLALSLKELQAIEPGDYIVHVDHGVGRFAGLLRTDVNGRTQEMIKLVYSGGDTIFVSIHALHKLSKYRGKEGVAPKINKLGSGAWNRLKEKTKTKLKDIARDLIRLYAQRKQEPGYAFSPDSYLQHELEASFAYEDTPDQQSATAAVKADMEAPRPMDRLVCGDVGFGKTEVAIRAAFKAAVDSKQTAFLVPTTLLAWQHYNTLRERLADLPVRVEYLSRARSAKDTRQILADLAAGKIDILVGTHRIIGKDVKFHDLGLLVIDEEQKFGVAVKEKLKQLKTSVDTLTMSATPIPRTLQFSLMGARDLSAITTPPANRHPIITSVTTLSDDIVAEAVNFEMARGGQVFIVNNHIEGLEALEQMVKRLVPDARTVVAHGQMPSDKLEKAVSDFAAHDYDVLLATTIVENGIDMPNVNTIIINNAHRFGLSELHQLRGRVGRSSRKAFCYLTTPPGAPLTPVARRRLQAIESFSDLGSGIHIAMQDLDIRGAGNLLGAEQSGFIADLGYETYQKILREAVTELRTTEFADVKYEGETQADAEYTTDCIIDTDLELLLPPDYVPQESERIALYQELDSIEREIDLQAFRSRLTDRFGKMPHVTAELLRIPRLRRLARSLGIEKLVIKGDVMYFYFVGADNVAYYQSPAFGRIIEYLQRNTSRTHIRERGGRRSVSIDHVPSVEAAVDILQSI